MMIETATGNLLEADVDALVNTVNTVGVMGKGIALQFKQAFPANFKAYHAACKGGDVQLGRMFVHDLGRLTSPRYIINFPTKAHWRSRSRIADIREGLEDLRRVLEDLDVASVAVPPLGCGNGGLDWREVERLIQDALGDLPSTLVRVFPPAGAPAEEAMPVHTARPAMTPGRAALLVLAGRYDQLGFGVSQIEMQKLLYFLQELGEPLRLDYARGWYGPYAENLNHVLQRIEGHFIRGFGDRTKSPHDAAPLQLEAEAVSGAVDFLAEEPTTLKRIERVLDLADGFDSPYGLELLATLHWLHRHEGMIDGDLAALTDEIQSWSARKGRIFQSHHISAAWTRLRDEGWVEELQPA